MRVTRLGLEGLLLVELDIHRDQRGFFVERFNERKLQQLGLPVNFVQDNHSRSLPGVLRGLHFQHHPAQGKLVGCIHGRAWDIAVDIRLQSATFGKFESIELNESNGKMLWIPPGFAHGFVVLGDEPADVMYKVDHHYDPKGEGGILWNDPDLAVQWPISRPLISPKDERLMTFVQYRSNPPQFL